jgi:hypothetical protein
MSGALSIGTWATLGALPRLLLTWLVISCLAFTTAGTVVHQYTLIKNKIKLFLIYTEIQSGAVAKSYMRKGFLIHEERRKYLTIYEEAISHI